MESFAKQAILGFSARAASSAERSAGKVINDVSNSAPPLAFRSKKAAPVDGGMFNLDWRVQMGRAGSHVEGNGPCVNVVPLLRAWARVC